MGDRIVQIIETPENGRYGAFTTVLTASGRVFYRPDFETEQAWTETRSYPPGCTPPAPTPAAPTPAAPTPADEAGEDLAALLDRIDAAVRPFATVQSTFREVEEDGEVLPDGTGSPGAHYETNTVMIVHADDTVEHFATAADAQVAAYLTTVTPGVVARLVAELRSQRDARARAASAVPVAVRGAVVRRLAVLRDSRDPATDAEWETLRAWLRATAGVEGVRDA